MSPSAASLLGSCAVATRCVAARGGGRANAVNSVTSHRHHVSSAIVHPHSEAGVSTVRRSGGRHGGPAARAWRWRMGATADDGADPDPEGFQKGEEISSDGEEAAADAVAPEDYALVVELLDVDTGEELKEKVDLVAKNGLLTEGVINAARVVVESNEAAGQDPEIIDLLRSVYDVLLRKFKEMYAPAAKAALEFGSTLMDVFSAEDLEAMEAGEIPVTIGKVKLMMQEEFDREGGVDKMAFAKYLDEVLPVMSMQDERLKQKMAEAQMATDDAAVQKLVGVMMQRTKERIKVEALRDIAFKL